MGNDNDYYDGYNHQAGGSINSDQYNNNSSYRAGVDNAWSRQVQDDVAKSLNGPSYSGGGSGSGCFHGDTLIQTPHGARPIKEITIGTMVMSWNETRAQLVERPVTAVKVHKSADIIAVELEDGSLLKVTPNHTVLSSKGWRRIGKLRPSDVIVCSSDKRAKIKAMTQVGDKAEVYNLITKGEHNFVANGVVAHNFTILRRARTSIHRLCEHLGELREMRARWKDLSDFEKLVHFGVIDRAPPQTGQHWVKEPHSDWHLPKRPMSRSERATYQRLKDRQVIPA